MLESAVSFCKRRKIRLHDIVTCNDCGILLPREEAVVADDNPFIVLCVHCGEDMEAEANANEESLGNNWW